MATTDEEKLAADAQDGARKQYAQVAKTNLSHGLGATYTVQPGDTFESIAAAVYGDKDHGADIFDASLSSGAVSSDRKAELAAGTVLTLPVVAGKGQPSADDTAAAAADRDEHRATGERASSGPAREGGVGDTTTATRPRAATRPRRTSSSKRKR